MKVSVLLYITLLPKHDLQKLSPKEKFKLSAFIYVEMENKMCIIQL